MPVGSASGAERTARSAVEPEEEPVRRTSFTEEHEQFRQMVRAFLEKECVPHTAEWLEAGVVSREAWRKAGELGLLGWMVPEEYGGLGIRDFRYSVVVAGGSPPGPRASPWRCNDVVAPYLADLTNPENGPVAAGFVTGERLVAIAMSEPGAGSDLKQVKATARRDGDSWYLNGTKTFISNGILANLVIVVAGPSARPGHRGMSLLVVEEGLEGFARGRKLDRSATAPRTPPSCSFVTFGCRPRTCSVPKAGASTT